jgi:hypothetical protein
MACTNLITSGLGYECVNNMAGIQNVYITDISNVSGYTETNNEITAIAMSGSSKFYDFYIRPASASVYTEAFTISKENGSTYVVQTLTLDFLLRDSVKRNAIALMAYGQKRMAVIIKDYNDKCWYMGKIDGAMLINTESTSGANKGDRNGYTVTLEAEEKEMAIPVVSTIIAGLL